MTDENKEEAKKALFGCLAGTAVGIAIGALIWIVWFGNVYW
jgi:hypothetical protein